MSDLVVETEGGRIEGRRDGGVCRFLGVPYAAPPTGARRWRPPAPVEPWDGVRPALTFGAAAIQAPRPGLPLGTDARDEDCLYLNIWTPSPAASARLPVMVWFHGGGYVSGAGSEPVYDGAALAAHGAVVVTLNYRLHVFGYLAIPGSGANFGLRDQLAALGWVKRHAAAFGGDPGNITVLGESAGAGSVHSLLASPAGDGLFQKAVMQSGGFNQLTGLQERRSLAQAHAVSRKLFDALGDDRLDHLRHIPAPDVWQCAERLFGFDLGKGEIILPHQLVWAPVEDGELLPFGSATMLRGQRPLLFGWNANEGRYFFRPGTIFTRENVGYVASRLCGLAPDQVSTLLAIDSDEAVYESLDRLFSTAMGAETAITLGGQADAQDTPAYIYTFRRVSPGAARTRLLANHTAELPYMFGTLEKVDGDYEDTDRRLSRTMQRAWVAFAKTGAPMLDDRPWPRFARGDPRIAVFDDAGEVRRFSADPLFRAIQAERAKRAGE